MARNRVSIVVTQSMSDIFRDDSSFKKETFSSSLGLILSCLGSVVGTGNVWRFPRIAAQNSANQGSLAFLIVWVLFLFLWSSPMILIEYAVGRYTKSSPLKSFRKFMGDKAVWCGGWVTMVTFMMSSYYSVVLGWCLYYVYHLIGYGCPGSKEESDTVFYDFVRESSWPVLTHFLAIFLAGLAVIGGVKWIEKANMVLVPMLLGILLFTFCWSLSRDYSDYGIRFLFTPNWESIANPRLWVDAASQNAFDTGAAFGLFITYASYMTRKNGVVKYATMIPLANNCVSLLCGITIFSTVFSTLITTLPELSRAGIVEVMKTSGPGSTGLTFIWMPVLFSKFGVFGRVLGVLFFFCLSCAGISSLISNIELTVLTLTDFGLPRRLAAPIIAVATFLVGLGSALNLNFLTNQDFVWGFALMISGVMMQLLVIIYGVLKFRRVVVNEFGIGDWTLPIPWVGIVTVIAPFEAVGLLVWWAYDLIQDEPGRWYKIGNETFMITIVEWLGLLVFVLLVNLVLYYKRPAWFDDDGAGEQPIIVYDDAFTSRSITSSGIEHRSQVESEMEEAQSFWAKEGHENPTYQSEEYQEPYTAEPRNSHQSAAEEIPQTSPTDVSNYGTTKL